MHVRNIVGNIAKYTYTAYNHRRRDVRVMFYMYHISLVRLLSVYSVHIVVVVVTSKWCARASAPYTR